MNFFKAFNSFIFALFKVIGIIILFTFSSKAFNNLPYSDSTKTDSLRKKNLKFLALPVFLKSPETGIGLGTAGSLTFKTKLEKADSSLRTSNTQLLALYTLRKQTIIAIDGSVFFPKEKYILRFHNTFSNFPDRFWGLGNRSLKSNEENFSYQQLYIFPQFLKKIYGHFFAGVSFEYQHIFHVKYNQSGLFEKEHIIGIRKSNVNGLGLLLSYDSRNNAFSPDKGEFLEVSSTSFTKIFRSDYKYLNIILDGRKFIKVRKSDVLAFQLYAYLNHGQVPFLSLAALGGSSIMRGYYSGRFRDKNLFAFQSEYRLHLYKRFGLVAFAGIGEVTQSFRKMDVTSIKYALGGGFRFAVKKSEKLNIRLDYGKGPGTSGAYLTVSEAF